MMMLAPLLAGSGTAAAGAGVAGAVAGGFSFAKVLSLGAGVASGLASLAKGRAEAAGMESEAAWEEFNSRQELMRGRAESLDAVRATNDAIASAQVAGFASGLQSSGSIRMAQLEAQREGEFQSSVSRNQGEIAASARRSKATQLRFGAKQVRAGSMFEAVGNFASVFSRFRATG